MPKFSEQRILKSKEVLCSFLSDTVKGEFLFKEKILQEATRRTELLVDIEDESFSDILDGNLKILINSYVEMSIPLIRHRFESGYALFKPNDEMFKCKDERFSRFFIFNKKEMIEYIINRQLMLLMHRPFRFSVIGYYSRTTLKRIADKVGLTLKDIIDEIDYARSSLNIRLKDDRSYIPFALSNCNKFREYISIILDASDKQQIINLFESVVYSSDFLQEFSITKYKYIDNYYYIVPVIEEKEIEYMKDVYDIVLRK